MSQQVFTGMSFPKDSAGTKGTALLQLRNGLDEPITPITLWELDTDTNLYLPPGSSSNPKAPRVSIRDALPAGENLLGSVSINGSLMELRGLAANKPAASAVTVGATYWSVDTDPHADAVEVSDGTTWTVI